MKEVIINQCDYCKKTSFNKSKIKQHEKICFYNPATQSCATCLWFSPLYTFYNFQCFPVRCYAKRMKAVPEDYRMKLKTQRKRWINVDIYSMNETCDNQDEMEENLLSGKFDYFKKLLA